MTHSDIIVTVTISGAVLLTALVIWLRARNGKK